MAKPSRGAAEANHKEFLRDPDFDSTEWWLTLQDEGPKRKLNIDHPELLVSVRSSHGTKNPVQIEPAPILWEFLRRNSQIVELRAFLKCHLGATEEARLDGQKTSEVFLRDWPIGKILTAFDSQKMRTEGLLTLFGHLPWSRNLQSTDNHPTVPLIWREQFQAAVLPRISDAHAFATTREYRPADFFVDLLELARKEAIRNPRFNSGSKAAAELGEIFDIPEAAAHHLKRLVKRSKREGRSILFVSYHPGISAAELKTSIAKIRSHKQTKPKFHARKDDLLLISKLQRGEIGDLRAYGRRLSEISRNLCSLDDLARIKRVLSQVVPEQRPE